MCYTINVNLAVFSVYAIRLYAMSNLSRINILQSNVSRETAQGTEKMLPLRTGGLLTQVTYSTKCAFWSLKGRSLNTGGLWDRFNCIYNPLLAGIVFLKLLVLSYQ